MKQSNKNRILSHYVIVLAVLALVLMRIVYLLFSTTVVKAGAWNARADSTLTVVKTIEPERGRLLADNGTVLAANLNFYTVRIDFKTEKFNVDTFYHYLPELSDSLSKRDPSRTPKQWADALSNAQKHGKRAYPLFKNLSYDEYCSVKKLPFFKKGRKYTGLYDEKTMKRSKPYGDMASRAIGTVSQSEAPSKKNEIHGRSGLEMALDSLLYGHQGKSRKVQVTHGIVDVEDEPAVRGYDVTTTINVALQDIVETELAAICAETNARWGTAVLMEVATGEIKAMSNLEWKESEGRYKEGVNHAVLGYEPGSVMKPISMMIALEDGIISNIDQPIPTGQMFMYGGRKIEDHPGGDALSPRQIIETSSNVGMSKIIRRKYESYPDNFRKRLEEIGFFEPFHSGIAGEQVPRFAHLGRTTADRVALTRMCFGYSSLVPPLSTLAMYNAIANDGVYVAPHLYKKLSRQGEQDSIIPVRYIRQQVCSPVNAQKLRVMLHDVVWGNRGTARNFLKSDKVEIAGKTGTAYTIDANGHYGTQKRLAFCGFFPYENPKYSCVVLMLGANRGAAASSGMVLKNVALKMYARGLLGDTPNYTDSARTEPASSKPTLYASSDTKRNGIVKRGLGLASIKRFATPQPAKKGIVPDVRGLSVREAISRLESEGLQVRFSGNGYVSGQSIPAGSHVVRGQIIHLQLRH